jgi:FkbM family methyltransferase
MTGTATQATGRWPAVHPLVAIRTILTRAECVRERSAFIRRELGSAERLAEYHLRGTALPFWLRHNTPDVFALDQAFVQRHFELPPQVHAFLSGLPELRVLDLGANIGLFAISVLAEHPNATITSFEPDGSTIPVLARTAASNGATSWTIVEAAAATRAGRVPFEGGRFGLSRVSPNGSGTETVPSADVFPHLGAADLVKIDIEGSEWPILLEERFARVRAQVIHLEYHRHLCPEPDPKALAGRLLTAAGYEVEQLVVTSPTEGILLACRKR